MEPSFRSWTTAPTPYCRVLPSGYERNQPFFFFSFFFFFSCCGCITRPKCFNLEEYCSIGKMGKGGGRGGEESARCELAIRGIEVVKSSG